MTGKDLAKRLGVARSTLSEATKEGYLVGGRWDVQSWANFGPNGRVRGYDVPDGVLDTLRVDDVPPPRENPPKALPMPESRPNSGDKPPPRTQDYLRPVATTAAGTVAWKAIDADNPTAHALTMALGAGIFSLFFYEMSGRKAAGGVLGGLFGVGITAWGLGKLRRQSSLPVNGTSSAQSAGSPSTSAEGRAQLMRRQDVPVTAPVVEWPAASVPLAVN